MMRFPGSSLAWGAVAAFSALAPLAMGGCQTPSADGPADTYGLDFRMPPTVDVRGAVIFFLDGVNAQIFQEMLQKGELPAIRKYFVDRGMYCPRAVASVPTVTLPNEVSVVTGLLPGHHGVTGIRWFDRNRMVFRDYATVAQKNLLDRDYIAPTLYERFPDRPTLSLFFEAHRGATYFDENAVAGAAAYVAGLFEFIDRMDLSMFRDVIDQARATGRFPGVTVCYLLSPDFHAYRFGVESEQYRHALRHADRQIGRVLADMERAGILENLHVALVSDHGHTPTPRNLDIRAFLRDQAGLELAASGPWESTAFADRQKAFAGASAVATVCGNRYSAVYLRKVARDGNAGALRPWLIRPGPEDFRAYPSRAASPVDLPALLLRQEAVDAIAYASGANRVRLGRKGGEVEFRQEGGPGGDISYSVVSGDDPLEWHGPLAPELRSGPPASPRRWLEGTVGTSFPGVADALLAYFRSRAAGDLAVFAAPGWQFFDENHSGHGGLYPAEVFAPLLLAGPGVPHGAAEAVRTVDLAPTLLKLQGRPLPAGLDGIPLPGVGEANHVDAWK